MKVLLTGATGFVGSHVARLLVREGCDVLALVRPGSNLSRIADIQSQLHLIRGDVLSPESFEPGLRSLKPELCIHLAWYAKPGEYLHAPENIDLMAGTIKFVMKLADIGCRRVVGIGTCFEYDTDAGYLSETTRLDPTFPYSAAKAATFMMLKNLSLSNMTFVWARLFYQYGPFENERRLVPSVICALLRGEDARCTRGEQIRDFLHIEDVASALWNIAQSSITGGVNVGSGSPTSVAQLVSTIGEIVGRSDLVKLGAIPYAKKDPHFVCANNRRLREETGWRPQLSIHDGLSSTVAWWRSRVLSS